MTDVAVLILHPEPSLRAGELERWVAAARAANAERHRLGFLAVGATDVGVASGAPDRIPFGARMRAVVAASRAVGLVVLGSGAIPLARAADRRAFVDVASATRPLALANNRFSADVIAVSESGNLGALPDLATDNELPRWLADVAGYEVTDLRRRWRLGVDIDGPLDLVLIDAPWMPPAPAESLGRVADRLASVRAVARDPHAELIVAGRTSAAGLTWLERSTAARTRALVEERGLRTARAGQRPPRSVLGALLDNDGAAMLGAILAKLGEAALVDTRVLLAHRLGTDETRWPPPADRFASDLLHHEEVADPWLRDLTRSAAEAAVPIVLGGHTLVGPGLRLAVGGPGGDR